MTAVTDAELLRCRDCRVWDPDSQPSVQRQLERDPDAFEDRLWALLETGMSLAGPGFQLPLSVELLLCPRHQALVEPPTS